VTEKDQLADGHLPKHLLETGLLGKVKHGQKRVSEIAAKQDDTPAGRPESSDGCDNEEQVT
jgi:hypothetical protein